MSRIRTLMVLATGLVATVAFAQQDTAPPAAPHAPGAAAHTRQPGQPPTTAEPGLPPKTFAVLKGGTPEHRRLVLHLKNSSAQSVGYTVNSLLIQEARLAGSRAERRTSLGSVVMAVETGANSLVISGSPDAVEEVRKLVEELDQPADMVMLEMEIGEAPAGEVKVASEGPRPEGKATDQARTLEKPPHMEIIGRVRLTAMNNQQALVQIGSRVPRVIAAQKTAAGMSQSTTSENVGLILCVTPRISDGVVAMVINTEKAQFGPEGEGTPILTSGNTVVRTPRIDKTSISTTVRVLDGQTVILGSVARENKSGKELLIIVTPHILRSDDAKKPR
jgi:hypothetical protein